MPATAPSHAGELASRRQFAHSLPRCCGAEEVLEVALRLLDEYDCADSEWLNSVRAKIDAAVAVSEQTPPINGETFIAGILERSRQERETQT
jgi:antitoxin ParD1/3/4